MSEKIQMPGGLRYHYMRLSLGVGDEPASPKEFEEFWNGLENYEREYYMEIPISELR